MNNQDTKTFTFNSDNMYQNVYVTLSDGTVGMFSGPAVVTGSGDVQSVSFSQPKPLPEGQTWNNLWQTQ